MDTERCVWVILQNTAYHVTDLSMCTFLYRIPGTNPPRIAMGNYIQKKETTRVTGSWIV